jgi:hypothetical protein
MGAFRDVMRGFHAGDVEQCPQGLACPLHTPGKRPGVVLSGSVVGDQGAEARLPGPPLPDSRAFRAHRTQPLELGVYSLAEARDTGVEMLSQPLRCTEEMGPAALAQSLPMLRDERPITDQDTHPIRHQWGKGSLGTVWMYLEIGHLRVRHPPQPVPVTLREPGRLVTIVDQSRPRHLSKW